MEKKSLVIGNWKMELSHKGEVSLIGSLKDLLRANSPKSQVVVCPSFVSLSAIKAELVRTKRIALGAQNVFWEDRGAWTGQISLTQLKSFVTWCIVGHSEVREVMRPQEEIIARQAMDLLNANIRPIICIGETKEERDRDRAVEKIRDQVDTLLQTFDRSAFVRAVIAYEPIWAIGTGIHPEPDDIAEVVLLIRRRIAERHDRTLADRTTILYGGSVKPGIAAQYVGGPLADGLLVGGASIHPKDFFDIITEVDDAFA